MENIGSAGSVRSWCVMVFIFEGNEIMKNSGCRMRNACRYSPLNLNKLVI